MTSVGKLVSEQPRVLLDDDAAFACRLRCDLEAQGFLAEHASNGQEAPIRIAQILPHVVLLDWKLPVFSGIEECRRLRRQPETKDLGVIMVTRRAGDRNVVRGLNAGADDYVIKPFSVAELLARIRALLRRTGADPEGRYLQFREILMDLTAFRVTRNGQNIHLGPTEFWLLKLLMRSPNRVFSRDELIDEIWGAEANVEARTVDVYVRRLRKSITREDERDVIRTVRVAGYGLDSG
jgi:two-component system phosphate regulon response regulator PhoB